MGDWEGLMRRHLVMGLAILGFAACGQGERGVTEQAADVGAAGASATSPYVATCLEMATAQNWAEASRLCAMALTADPGDSKVKSALAAAKAALAAEPGIASDAAANPSGEAAGEAADSGAEDAQPAEEEQVH